MLVLSRRTEESIIIDDDIKITVLGLDSRGEVKLGIEAPDDVVIVREELSRGGQFRISNSNVRLILKADVQM